MSGNEFNEVPHTIGCKFSQGIVCSRWLQSDGAILNRRAINHSNLSILEGLAALIGSHLTREPTVRAVLSKWWNWELMLATNFGSLCPEVTNFGSQNFGYQIWFCTRLGNGLAPDGTKPLPGPKLTFHQWSLVVFTWQFFYWKHLIYQFIKWLWKLHI